MKKAAVIFAPGCEEGEALTIVDILRRAEVQCDIAGLGSDEITGTHGITMKADTIVSEAVCDYDISHAFSRKGQSLQSHTRGV